MAKLMLIGEVAQVEITCDNDDRPWFAECCLHDGNPVLCFWTRRYSTLNDAVKYAADHADRGIGR